MIAESRLVWQKFDDEMKKLESRSFSRIGGQDKIEQGNITNTPTTATEKDIPVTTEKHKNEKVSTKSSEINKQEEKEKFRENEREIITVVENDNDAIISSNILKDHFKEEDNAEDFSIGRRSSWFSPMKLVRFPSLFGEDKKFESSFSGMYKDFLRDFFLCKRY